MTDLKNSNITATKSEFKLQKGPNGLILIFHHTLEEKHSYVRVPMVCACFNYNGTQLVSIDSRGHIFAFDLSEKKFWKLVYKAPKADVIKHVPPNSNNYVIGTKKGEVILIDIDKGMKMKNTDSSERIRNISFAKTNYMKAPTTFLVHSDREALLINVSTFELNYRLKFDQTKAFLKFAMFIPKTNNILSCFTNDSMAITTGGTLETIRTLHPIHARDRYLKLQHCEELSLYDELTRQFELIINSEIKDYSNGLINHLDFSSDGVLICLATLDSYIIILSATGLEIVKIIKLKDTTFRSCCFMSSPFGMMLFGVTSIYDAVLIDCNNLAIKSIVKKSEVYTIDVTPNGKLMFTIQESGEVCVYLTSIMYNALKTTQHIVNSVTETTPLGKIGVADLYSQLKSTLNGNTLLPILKEYGHYPDKYRHLIWCTMLDLPCNKSQFTLLVKQGDWHLSVQNLDNRYSLKDVTALRNLKKIVSYLSNWSKIFAHTTELPKFVFPFMKIFPNSLILVFEMIATLLLNHCQLWFEFHPFEPMNYFGLCENILKQFDPNLWQFYVDKDISPKIYAWPLMITAFSEVLEKEQWFHLWDNILTYPSYFPVFCIVAYSIIQRKVIMNIKKQKSFVAFFRDQNLIDLKKFIKKSIYLMEKCPENLHPKKYMTEFQPLPKGFYPKFENYPVLCVEQKEAESVKLQKLGHEIDLQIRKLEQEEIELEKALQTSLKQEESTKRIKEVEKLYQDAISTDYEQIEIKQKLLLLYQKQLRNTKSKVLQSFQDSSLRTETNLRASELDSLIKIAERKQRQADSSMILANDSVKDQEMNKFMQKLKPQKKPPSLKFKLSTEQITKEPKIIEQNKNKQSKENIIDKDDVEDTSDAEFQKTLKQFEESLTKIKQEFQHISSGKNKQTN